MDEFRVGLEGLGREWDFDSACEIMGINQSWFVTHEALRFVKMYLFYKQNPSAAYPVPFDDQPCDWVQAKIILDSILAEPRLM